MFLTATFLNLVENMESYENFKSLQQSFKVSIILIEIQPYEEFQLALDIRDMVQPPLKVSTPCLNY